MFIMFNGKINYKWPFSICLFTRGYPEQSVNPQIAIWVDRIGAKWGPQNPEATAIRRQHVADSTSRPSGTDLRNAGKSAWSKAAPLGGRVAEWQSGPATAKTVQPIRSIPSARAAKKHRSMMIQQEFGWNMFKR